MRNVNKGVKQRWIRKVEKWMRKMADKSWKKSNIRSVEFLLKVVDESEAV